MSVPEFSKITCNIDLDVDGKQHGNLIVPWSRDESSWGSIPIPISVVKNGAGPTVLFTGANHGDEYEGPLALVKMRRWLDLADVSGRVIMIPALNLPAFRAGKRTSPIDGGNMNRAFPGRADGTITEMIAHYLTTRILPLCDGVVDVHAGGRSLGFLPSAIIHDLPDRGLMARTLAAMKAFAAPYSLVLKELDPVGMMDHVVENAGRVFVSTELGGGATSTAETIAIAERGLTNILKNFGILPGPPEVQMPGRILHTPDGDCFVSAPTDGLYEIVADLGAEVAAGQTLARIHHLEEPHRDPDILISARPGLVICRHVPGLIRRGDCAAVIAEDWSAAS